MDWLHGTLMKKNQAAIQNSFSQNKEQKAKNNKREGNR